MSRLNRTSDKGVSDTVCGLALGPDVGTAGPNLRTEAEQRWKAWEVREV